MLGGRVISRRYPTWLMEFHQISGFPVRAGMMILSYTKGKQAGSPVRRRQCTKPARRDGRMTVEISPRDYSLVGLDTKKAEERGLATAEWYRTPIPRKRLKELMQR